VASPAFLYTARGWQLLHFEEGDDTFMKSVYSMLMLMVVAGFCVTAGAQEKTGGGAVAKPTPAAADGAIGAAGGTGATATAGSSPESAAALRTAEQLAAQVRAAGTACKEFDATSPTELNADYPLPLAAATASCTSDADEDLTFEVFADAKGAREFVEAKRKLLCTRAVSYGVKAFTGFPYIDGGAWIIEPDEKETAEKLAGVVKGTAKMALCDNPK